MSLSQKIININKQNESIYSSLKTRGIEVDRDIIPEGSGEAKTIEILSAENNKLKELVKQNKPPNQVKEPKEPKVSTPVQTQSKVTSKVKSKDEDDELDEEELEPPKPKFECICNMEDIKRSFFNKDYEVAKNLILAQQLKYYTVNYKYSSDKDGVPDFVAKNLLKGFVRNLDDYRKYFMICFRCYKVGSNYEYRSYWIVNTIEPIYNIIGSVYDDFDFTEVTEDLEGFIKYIEKLDEDTEGLVGESYVH
jgi:hypothetical protein